MGRINRLKISSNVPKPQQPPAGTRLNPIEPDWTRLGVGDVFARRVDLFFGATRVPTSPVSTRGPPAPPSLCTPCTPCTPRLAFSSTVSFLYRVWSIWAQSGRSSFVGRPFVSVYLVLPSFFFTGAFTEFCLCIFFVFDSAPFSVFMLPSFYRVFALPATRFGRRGPPKGSRWPPFFPSCCQSVVDLVNREWPSRISTRPAAVVDPSGVRVAPLQPGCRRTCPPPSPKGGVVGTHHSTGSPLEWVWLEQNAALERRRGREEDEDEGGGGGEEKLVKRSPSRWGVRRSTD